MLEQDFYAGKVDETRVVEVVVFVTHNSSA
jgi:hypothetical protein